MKKSYALIAVAATIGMTLSSTEALAGSWGWRGGNNGVASGAGNTKAKAYSDLANAVSSACNSKGFKKTPFIGSPSYTSFFNNTWFGADASFQCY